MRLRFLAPAGILAALACAGAGAAHADTGGVERVFLERSAIAAADAACDLFTEGERFALKAGLYQSEDELLRANYGRAEIDDAASSVRAHARSLGCDHPSVREAAATVRASYRQFAKTNAMDYPGARGLWRASRVAADQWAMVETDKASGVQFGMRNGVEDKKPALRLAVAIPGDMATPSAARLFIRDPAKLDEPWLGSPLGPPRSAGARMTPTPRSMTRVVWASDTAEEDDISGAAYRIYYFPAAAATLIEALDPREMIQVELTPDPRAADRTPARIDFEVGDFRAAHAFVRIPQPTYAAAPEAHG